MSFPFLSNILRRCGAAVFASALCLLMAPTAHADFGLTSDTKYYVVDTEAGLVFKVRRTDTASVIAGSKIPKTAAEYSPVTAGA